MEKCYANHEAQVTHHIMQIARSMNMFFIMDFMETFFLQKFVLIFTLYSGETDYIKHA